MSERDEPSGWPPWEDPEPMTPPVAKRDAVIADLRRQLAEAHAEIIRLRPAEAFALRYLDLDLDDPGCLLDEAEEALRAAWNRPRPQDDGL